MWDFRPLREDLTRLYGRQHARQLQPFLDSIHDRRAFARYHFGEARDLIEQATGGKPDEEIFATMMFAADTDSDDFELARFKAAANIVACVQSMHALTDTLAQVIYLGCGLNMDPATSLKERQISIHSVADRIPAGTLKTLIRELITDPGFVYLAALNNHSKHRSIVDVRYSMDLSTASDKVHGLEFSAFAYGEEIYPQKWAMPTLIDEYARQEALIMAIGNEVNSLVSAKVAAL